MLGKTYGELWNIYEAHFAWDWQSDPYTRGVFALFNPSHFCEMFPVISRPAGGGYLHFAGEAISVHNARISGAPALAYRSVAEILMTEGYSRGDTEAALQAALTVGEKLLM